MGRRDEERDHRTGGADSAATGTTGVGRTENTDVSPQDAAEDINPGGTGTAAPNPRDPDGSD